MCGGIAKAFICGTVGKRIGRFASDSSLALVAHGEDHKCAIGRNRICDRTRWQLAQRRIKFRRKFAGANPAEIAPDCGRRAGRKLLRNDGKRHAASHLLNELH